MNKLIKFIPSLLVCFFVFYTLFWLYYFKIFPPQKVNKTISPEVKTIGFENIKTKKENKPLPTHEVLSVSTDNNNSINDFAQSYKIDILPRKQVFNLSCELAAASSIIFHYKENPDFSPQNEKTAEKILIEKIGASQNPNIGIRMGNTLPENEENLINNLNEKFGGTDYYGVHAPPFIEVFKDYGLTARPLNKNINLTPQIKKAIFSGHLIMSWLNVGYGRAVDIELAYGLVSVVRGEHVVVINGYDEKDIFFMDPASAKEKKLSYNNFLDAALLFPMPFLEVYPSTSFFFFDPTAIVDKLTGLNRSVIKIRIENGSKKTGAGSGLAGILKDFGYQVVEIKDIDCENCENIQVKIKEKDKDYLNLLKKDLELAFYSISNISEDLAEEDIDIIITIGSLE